MRFLADMGVSGRVVSWLSEQVHDAVPRYTPTMLLTGDEGGFGVPLDSVLKLDEAEKKRGSWSWWQTFITPLGRKLAGERKTAGGHEAALPAKP